MAFTIAQQRAALIAAHDKYMAELAGVPSKPEPTPAELKLKGAGIVNGVKPGFQNRKPRTRYSNPDKFEGTSPNVRVLHEGSEIYVRHGYFKDHGRRTYRAPVRQTRMDIIVPESHAQTYEARVAQLGAIGNVE